MSSPLVQTPIPIRIDGDGDLPIYLQIKYQLSYLITTERLAPGARLPPVRNLADQLNINQHTVAQAYRELQADGLIDSTAGRGSFVKEFGVQDKVHALRHERLGEVLDEARRRGRSLGFSDTEIIQHLTSVTHQRSVPCQTVYVDRIPHTAAKYAGRLEAHLDGTVAASPLTLDAIIDGAAEAQTVLGEAFYVVTVARNVPLLEQHLPRYAPAHEIITIVAELLPRTTAALAAITPETRAIMFTEEQYIYSSLNLVSLYSPLDPAKVEAFTPASSSKFIQAAKKAELIFYTFGVANALSEMELDERGVTAPRLQLEFDIGPDSVKKLRRVFGVGERGVGN
jgi:DNA-binding transcriptional regulator YhcF (GntR family)